MVKRKAPKPPVTLSATEAALVRMVFADYQRSHQELLAVQRAQLQPVLDAHGITGSADFHGNPDGTMTLRPTP